MTSTSRGTRRSLTALAALAATACTGALLAPTSATSAPSTGDCAVPAVIEDLAPHDPVTGLTVGEGTVPDPFTGEVLGVLENGIAPGLDMVITRLTSPEIDRVGGIWAGMSGSPVYAEDGTLIGAVAYGLTFGPSPVAGVTPFADMDDYLGTTAKRVQVTSATARTIAAATDVTAAEAVQGFARLPMPLGVSGVSQDWLTRTDGRAYLDKNARAMGSGGSSAGPEAIVAGGNLALTAAYGEIQLSAVGTTTSVCNDRVVAFGHPVTFAGKLTAAMHPADAIYIQEDPVFGPFKVANLGAPAGTITDDRLAGSTGTIGVLPDTVPITTSLTYGARFRTGTSHVSIPRYGATTAFYQLIGAHERVIDGYTPGSEEAAWTIHGHKADGSPFTVEMGDRYLDASAVIYEVVWDLPDMLYMLSRFPGVTVDEVTWTGTASDDLGMWTVSSLEYKSGGTWVPVTSSKDKIKAKAGRTLKLRVVLDDEGVSRKVPVSVEIPSKAAGSDGYLYAVGGSRLYSDFYGADSLAEFLKQVKAHVRNDEVQVAVFADGRRSNFEAEVTSEEQDQVVSGRKRYKIVIE